MTTGGNNKTQAIIPTHLGLILDGNRRWAVEQGLPAFEGHRHGYERLKALTEEIFARGVKFVTAFVFSTDNWQRPPVEVKFLMNLLQWVATHEVNWYDERNIRLIFLGKEKPLSPKILKAIRAAEAKTKANTGGTLAFCLNYGGQTEIAEAIQAIMKTGVAPEAVTPELIRQHIYHPEIPDLDFIIRTSGEQRLSNFMLWRAAYAELYFLADKHWPAFTTEDLDKALADYAARVRRFGQ